CFWTLLAWYIWGWERSGWCLLKFGAASLSTFLCLEQSLREMAIVLYLIALVSHHEIKFWVSFETLTGKSVGPSLLFRFFTQKPAPIISGILSDGATTPRRLFINL